MPQSTIPLNPCKSTRMVAHGHDPATNTLALKFQHDRDGKPAPVYHYPNFTPELYKEFCEAESLGKFFGARIKGNDAHPHTKMVEDEPAP